MCCSRNAGSPMDIDADITQSANLRFAGMQPHTHSQVDALWPWVNRKRPLGLHSGVDAIHRARKDNKESIALDTHHVPAVSLPDLTQQLMVVSDQSGVVFA